MNQRVVHTTALDIPIYEECLNKSTLHEEAKPNQNGKIIMHYILSLTRKLPYNKFNATPKKECLMRARNIGNRKELNAKNST